MRVISEEELNSLRSSRIFHETSVDFVTRRIEKPIHLLQYDKDLPIIEVSLYNNNEEYTLPNIANMNLRFSKRDGKFVYKPIMGCDETRKKIYFEAGIQMTLFEGTYSPILELSVDGNVAGSSYITIIIDRNPIQNSQIFQYLGDSEIILELATVALTGDWNDLTNKPEGFVLTVNGQSGQVDTYKESWNSATTYFKGDTVLYNDALYLSIKDENTNKNPTTEETYWKVYGGSPIPMTSEEINELWED